MDLGIYKLHYKLVLIILDRFAEIHFSGKLIFVSYFDQSGEFHTGWAAADLLILVGSGILQFVPHFYDNSISHFFVFIFYYILSLTKTI